MKTEDLKIALGSAKRAVAILQSRNDALVRLAEFAIQIVSDSKRSEKNANVMFCDVRDMEVLRADAQAALRFAKGDSK